ncbi:copper resistance CopC family protein [Arthrobacter sp. H16F315]|uniref:copper resistance CopC family protein n=1 Tax=Arthrobacter sp. H16F315 TaxID=2955314 RepID=UPI00209860C2|nr:copper resistance CopC family protein [Arthrobacter sp. H16F315]MDD1478683.1 copper resistance protein CopC [Arthrobacter sp. H16F315]
MRARFSFKTRLRLAAIAAILIPAATAASPALAHDSLSSTSPAADAVITHAPETVSLTLSEPPADSKNLNLSTITVTDGAGKTVSDGNVTVYGPTLSTKLSEGDTGTYKVLWRAVSSDGHPIEGNYTFTVQAQAGQTATSSATTSPAAAPSESPAASPAASAAAERAEGPNNDGAPLVLGIAAVILAAAIGTVLVLRNRRKNTGT